MASAMYTVPETLIWEWCGLVNFWVLLLLKVWKGLTPNLYSLVCKVISVVSSVCIDFNGGGCILYEQLSIINTFLLVIGI